MSAAGKVCTGFSCPYVALYSAGNGSPTYSSGQRLARGVSIQISPTTSDDNKFYADNVAAESAPGKFTGGTATLVVDGLLEAAEALIMGLPEATSLSYGSSKTTNVRAYGDAQSVPHVGIGAVVRYQQDGVESFAPMVLTKTRFRTIETEAETQEENINWQTQSLTADLFRDDSSAHNWKKVAEDQTTEAEAEAVLKALLNIAEAG